jgi:hypothetical protein
MGLKGVVAALLLVVASVVAGAEPVAVRFREGAAHGLLVLENEDGTPIASGDLIQTADGDRVTSRLVFRFKDGSLYDDTTVFSQRNRFQLLSDHLIEKGPAFPHAIDMSVDAEQATVTVRYDDHGAMKTASGHLSDIGTLANGLVSTLLKNVGSTPPSGLALIFATPKPRTVHLTIRDAGLEPFVTGGVQRKARHFVVKAEVGGVTGLFADIAGKQPPDSHVWILPGDAPAFVRSKQPLYADGPLWTIELARPERPRAAGAER